MRLLAIVIATFLAVGPAAAQSASADWRAVRAISAMWRPITQIENPAALDRACLGALEEMAAIDAAMPPVITPESLSAVKAIRGFLIVPGADDGPASAFLFPSRDLTWLASGLAAVASLSETDGLIGVRDFAGRNLPLQIGRAGQRPILRTRAPDGAMLVFVGCAPTGG